MSRTPLQWLAPIGTGLLAAMLPVASAVGGESEPAGAGLRPVLETPALEEITAAPAPTEVEASPPGRLLLQLRPRFTYIDQSNRPREAEATNMRVLLGYRTDPIDDFSFTGQLVTVTWLGKKRASNTPGNFASPYPLVGDPDKTDINLLHGDYTGLPDTRIRVGRQAIKLDNERFVGDADVRQMPQVFDAISVLNRSLPGTELFAAQAWHLRTPFGNRFESRTTLLNGRTHFDFGASVGAYTYLMDQPQLNIATGLSDNSSRTTGARLEGDYAGPGGSRWYYAAEAAIQRPYADGSPLIRARYHRLAFGPTLDGVSVQIGHERLGSNGGLYGLQVPLSYNTFQGWAYQFFSTPPEGLRDLSASLATTSGRVNFWLKYHEFKPDFGNGKFGHEWDFAFDYRVSDSVSVRGVYGRFRRDLSFVRPDADRWYITLKYDY